MTGADEILIFRLTRTKSQLRLERWMPELVGGWKAPDERLP